MDGGGRGRGDYEGVMSREVVHSGKFCPQCGVGGIYYESGGNYWGQDACLHYCVACGFRFSFLEYKPADHNFQDGIIKMMQENDG